MLFLPRRQSLSASSWHGISRMWQGDNESPFCCRAREAVRRARDKKEEKETLKEKSTWAVTSGGGRVRHENPFRNEWLKVSLRSPSLCQHVTLGKPARNTQWLSCKVFSNQLKKLSHLDTKLLTDSGRPQELYCYYRWSIFQSQ